MNPDLIFLYNEVFGPFPCEVEECGNEAWSIVISEEEAKQLQGDRFDKSCFVFKNRMGTAMCDDCLRAME